MASDMEIIEAASPTRGKLRIVAIMTALSVRHYPEHLAYLIHVFLRRESLIRST